jgi:hypothetical protein
MSGTFKNSSKKWHIKEKEAYPVMVALEKGRDLLCNPDGFSLYSDHKNLVYILDPERRQVMKHADDRLSRWALNLMTFKFSVEHISGEDNVVADMLSRWRIQYPQTVCGVSFKPGLCSSMHKEDFIWPDLREMCRLQKLYLTNQDQTTYGLTPVILNNENALVTKQRKKIFVPDAENIRLRLCMIAHCGLSGHRSIQNTFRILRSKFFWPKMLADIQKFCRECLHCAVADAREIIPRPLGSQMHAQNRNEILHYDFIKIGPSNEGSIYLLVIKDDFSGYILLWPSKTADADTVVSALLHWYSLFGIATCHISDQGSHFKNQVVQELNRRMSSKHHFTLPYAPWSNGTVEVVNREIRKLIRLWISEFRITLKDWVSLVPLIIHVLNFSVSPRLGYPPALVFGGFTTVNNIDSIFISNNFKSSKLSFDDLSKHISDLRISLENLHKEIQEKCTTRGTYSLLRNAPNFDVGDYVMYATRRNLQGPSRKSKPRWTGPYKVTACNSDWDFTILHLVTNEYIHAHSSRLKYYCDKDLHVTADLKYQITHDEMRYRVSKFINHRVHDGNYELLTVWEGFDVEDATWEPLPILFEDVPQLCKDYIIRLPQEEAKTLFLNQVGLR